MLDYFKESAYPVYILHQAAVVCIGYGIIRLSLGMAAKYALLLAASFTATLAAYQFIVRPVPILRFAFGMKPMTRRADPSTGSGRGQQKVSTLRRLTQDEKHCTIAITDREHARTGVKEEMPCPTVHSQSLF